MATEEEVKIEQPKDQKSPDSNNKKRTSFSSILILIMLILIMISIPMGIIRFNLLGAGDLLRPYIKSDSKFAKILPPAKNSKDIEMMNREELLSYIEENEKKIDNLKNTIKQNDAIAEEYTGTIDGFLKIEADRNYIEGQLKQIEKDRAKLLSDQNLMIEKMAKSDTSGFKIYYESLDKESAKQIYEKILKAEKITQEVQDFVIYYEKMDAESAAAIFEKMADYEINLVADIIKNMDKTKASKVLKSMDPKIAGRISDILAKKTPLK